MTFSVIRKKIVLISAIVFAAFLAVPFSAYAAGLIPCGGLGEDPCTICYIIVGFNGIINKALYLSFFVGLAVFAFAAVMYTVSAGDSGMIDKAKGAMKNAVIGIVVMFSAWLMVNYTMQLLGTKPGLGIENVGSWDNFQCVGTTANTGVATNPDPSPAPVSSDPKSYKEGVNRPVGAPCGLYDEGKCMNTIATFCPFGYSKLLLGADCEWGAGCCI